MSADFDVVIAGGGYAAQLAARDLLTAGKRVALFDRRWRAGYPPQSTSGLARRWVRRFGLPVGDGSTPIRSFRVYGPGGAEALLGDGLLGEVGDVMVEPDVLARMERVSAEAGLVAVHGVTVLSTERRDGGWSTTVAPGGERVRSRYVFDATGFQAWLGRRAGIAEDLDREDAHGGVEVTVDRPGSHPEGEVRMWLGHGVAPLGYGWAFPSTEDGRPTVRVGLGTPRAAARTAGEYFGAFLRDHPEYGGKVHHRVGGVIPTAPVARTLERGGLFLLGDAARVCCPITGGGIWGALASGEAAAASVIAGAPESYAPRLRWLTDELAWRWALKQFAYGLNDRELGELVRFLGTLDLPRDGDVDPLRERRRVTRRLALRHPWLLATLLRRGRFWRAWAGRRREPLDDGVIA